MVPLSSLRPSGQRPAYYYNYARYSAEAKPARSSSLAQLFFCQIQSHSVYVLISNIELLPQYSNFCISLCQGTLGVQGVLKGLRFRSPQRAD